MGAALVLTAVIEVLVSTGTAEMTAVARLSDVLKRQVGVEGISEKEPEEELPMRCYLFFQGVYP